MVMSNKKFMWKKMYVNKEGKLIHIVGNGHIVEKITKQEYDKLNLPVLKYNNKKNIAKNKMKNVKIERRHKIVGLIIGVSFWIIILTLIKIYL